MTLAETGWRLVLLLLPTLLGPAQGALTEGVVEGVVLQMKVRARIEHRYAVTEVASLVFNPSPDPARLAIHLALPARALLAFFAMEVEGTNYTATINPAATARAMHRAASPDTSTAVFLQPGEDGLQRLEVVSLVDAHHIVTFHTRYEELVERRGGAYRYSTYIHPGYRIPRVEVVVQVLEREVINQHRILELPGQELTTPNPGTTVNELPHREGALHVRYHHEDPHDGTGRGVDGAFSLTYRTTTYADGGEVQRVGSYFAHYFSPEGGSRLPLHTVFLLDVSHSMYNGRLDALKTALTSVLSGLHPSDSFELLAFSSDVVSMGVFTTNKRQVKKAIRKVKRLVSLSNSDLNTALVHALAAARDYDQRKHVHKQVVVFSDGRPTSGVTDQQVILHNARHTNVDKVPVFAFNFGGPQSKLLDAVCGDNMGFAQDVHPNVSMLGQIKSFFSRVAEPLVVDLDVKFNESEVDTASVVESPLTTFYAGAEHVSAGLVVGRTSRVEPLVSGRGPDGPRQFEVTRYDSQDPVFLSIKSNFIARLWAYMTVQDLLAKVETSHNLDITKRLQEQILTVALKFSFVTPLSSLVLVCPGERYTVVGVRPPGSPVPAPASLAAPDTYRRLGRSNLRGNIPHIYVDLDPHFVVHARGLDIPLCFHFNEHNGAFVSLIRDPHSDIVVNGHATTASTQARMTYYTTLFLHLGHVNLTVTPDHLAVDCLSDDHTPQVGSITRSLWPFYKRNGKKYRHREKNRNPGQMRRRSGKGRSRRTHDHQRSVLHPERSSRDAAHNDVNFCQANTTWNRGVGRIYGNVLVLLNKQENLHIKIGDGLAHFEIIRSRKRHGRRYLGFYIRDQKILSSQATGIIGQFASKNLKVLEPKNSTVNKSTRMDTSVLVGVEHERGGVNVVSGAVGRRQSLMEKTKMKCIQVHGNGRGLLDGQSTDYLLECLQC